MLKSAGISQDPPPHPRTNKVEHLWLELAHLGIDLPLAGLFNSPVSGCLLAQLIQSIPKWLKSKLQVTIV
jgi:hypothetical protein